MNGFEAQITPDLAPFDKKASPVLSFTLTVKDKKGVTEQPRFRGSEFSDTKLFFCQFIFAAAAA